MPETLDPLTVEARITMLEKEVARLKMQLEQLAKPKENWIERITGSKSDIPEEVWAGYQKCMEELDQADRAANGLTD
jgi:hypothetical protein